MPLYAYQYLSSGRKRRGIIDALTLPDAKAKLRAQGIMVTRLAEEQARRRRHNLRGQNLLHFTKQLAQLLQAGMPIFESLSALEEQAQGEPYHRILASLCEAIQGGATLSQAMAHHPHSFDNLYQSMIAAGESSGNLDTILQRLAQLLTRQMRLRKQITTALVYPALIASFSLIVIFLLLTFAIPSIESLFEGKQLSTFTALVLGTSHLLSNYWHLYLPTLALASFALYRYLHTPSGKLQRHRLTLQLPLIRTLTIQSSLARFSRTLSTLQQGGLPMIDSLRLARALITNPLLREPIEEAERRIVEGSSLSTELSKKPLIPKLVSRMLRVGEESGDLTPMLEQIADLYESEVEKTISRLTTLAQPTILIILGGIVGIIMLAVLLPLTDVSSLF